MKNLNFHNFNDLNISNSSEKELNDILTDDLLTYSEDKSQSIINMNSIIDNNNRIIDNHNQSLKDLISKKENCSTLNPSEKSLNTKNISKNKNKETTNALGEKNFSKENNDLINGNNNKDLSSLQISLSNLLSDIDSKDIFINQNNKAKEISNNNINKIDKNDNLIKQNYLIDISNENGNLSTSNNIAANNNTNNSLCNYSQSLNISNNANNINPKNFNIKNKNIFSIGNNYIQNSNTNGNSNKKTNSKNTIKYNKEQNINIILNSKENNQNKEKNNKMLKKIRKDDSKINNNENYKLISPFKQEYKIEKGENIQLSIISNLNNYNKKINNYNNTISINKEQNFTINNSILDNNLNEYYDIFKNNITSLDIVKEKIKFKNKQNVIKNKIKLINNKNIDIQKDESKKFFYNPKIKNNSNIINNCFNKEIIYKNYKTESNLICNNKTELSVPYIENKDKKLVINNYNKSDNNRNNYYINTKKINNISYHIKNPKSSKSYNKNINKNEDIKKCNKKLYYFNKKRKASSSYNNSHNNSCNSKKQMIKIRKNTRNIELSELNSNNNFSISFNNKNNNKNYYESTKSKSKKKVKKNECVTEPSKQKKDFLYDSYKHTNIITNDFMNQIKSAQKETTNKLINKLNNMNNINIINKGILFPTFSIINEKNLVHSISKNKKIKEKNKNQKSKSKKKKIQNKDEYRFNKVNCFTEDLNSLKQKKNKNKDKSHKKINTQINLVSLLNNFNKKEKSRKNNKSLFNFGNIFFINQSQLVKKDSDTQISNLHEKNEINKEKIIIINDNYYESTKLNTLNYSNIKHRPQIINDFSNYKKKGNSNIINNKEKNNNEFINQAIKNNDIISKRKKINSDINHNKNNIIIKNKIRDSFKLRKVEGDSGNDIIKGI